MFPMGIAAATAILVSRNVGAGSPAGARRAFWMGMQLAMVALFLLSALIFLFPETVAGIFSKDPALIAVVVSALVLSCLFFMADGAQVVASNALRARGDIWWPTGMHFFSYVVIMLPLGWWLAVPKQGGLDGIVWSVIVASLISGGALVWRFHALGDRMKVGHG
jgi:MATE family multidrug resistance protein